MIKETYCSKEVCNLLKEKGFDEPCHAYYDDDNGKLRESYSACAIRYRSNPCVFGIGAPTQQIVMRWLREVHNLSVEVYRTACGYIGCIVAIPSGTDIKFLEDDGDDLPSGTYTKWEYACEATIQYSLKHLI